MFLQEMQPAQADADPAAWADGQLKPSNQATESPGSAPSASHHADGAGTADSAATPGEADASASSTTSINTVRRPEQGNGQTDMQTEGAEQELEHSMLSRGQEHVCRCCLLPCFQSYTVRVSVGLEAPVLS